MNNPCPVQEKCENAGCKAFCNEGYVQVLDNICNDTNISDEARVNFFEYLEKYDVSSKFKKYFCDDFFHHRQRQGQVIDDFDYAEEVGHVMKFIDFAQCLRRAEKHTGDLPETKQADKVRLKWFLVDSKLYTQENIFEEYVTERGIEQESLLCDHIMWTFGKLDNSDEVYDIKMYDMRDLPCLLGLSEYK
ncbi:MAG: hypothetical protein LBU51_01730, partial [Bacteroidales bacterium]|nr:hypothetical protein [Bacteroidales bacterium]